MQVFNAAELVGKCNLIGPIGELCSIYSNNNHLGWRVLSFETFLKGIYI